MALSLAQLTMLQGNVFAQHLENNRRGARVGINQIDIY